MRILSFLLLICLLVLGITFAILNSEFVVVHYYLGAKSLPLSVLMLLVWILGIIIGLLFSIPKIIKLSLELRRLRHGRGLS